MALGAITPQSLNPSGGTAPVDGGALLTSATNVVGDSSYPTGGSAISAAKLGFGNRVTMADVQIVGATGTNSGAVAATAVLQADGSIKLKCWVTTGVSPVQLQEAAAAANLSGLTFQIQASGY